MSCEVASWIPAVVASTLVAERSSEPVIAWLSNIRACIEEYDPLVTVRPPSPQQSETESSTSPDSAFDEILSQLGKEIYKLDEYQRILAPDDKEDSLNLSILDIFDECLDNMKDCNVEEVDENGPIQEEIKPVNGEDSDRDSTLSDVSFVTSAPTKSEVNDTNQMTKSCSDKSVTPPVPPRRTKFFTPIPPDSECNSLELKTENGIVVTSKRESDSDSESTCWSYKECSTDGDEHEQRDSYAVVWKHSSGFHNSDAILRHILSQQYATISRISFDTASDFSPAQYSVYSLQEVGDRCARATSTPVAAMTPDRPTDDGYEPVHTNENIYEEIEYGGYTSYTDEGCSCGGSIEVESISMSASSEGVGRESPLYVNLKDNNAYAVTPDVIFWKNLLFHPDYCEDEEDEWITPEECAVYTRDQRPPLVIPRITQYRKPREEPRSTPINNSYSEESPRDELVSLKQPRHYERLQDSPTSDRSHDLFSKSSSDSPPLSRLNKRFGGSTENLLAAERNRRPNNLQLQVPASSSGDSLDVEVRGREPGQLRSRKVRSMLAQHRVRSPVPTPRTMLPHNEVPQKLYQESWPQSQPIVLREGPVKRTKFFESGKKVSKKWIECYMVLTPTALHFYKDQKTFNAVKMSAYPGQHPSTPPSLSSVPRPEINLTLKNAHALQCIPKHTKRYTKSIVLHVDHDQYLIQDETEEGIKIWLKLIQDVYYKLGPKTDEDEYLNPSSNTDLESLGRTPPVSRHAHINYQKAGGSSNEDLSELTNEVSKSHVKRRLRNFFAKRPTMDSLVKKGIYQEEPVFGTKLEQVCPKNTSPRIPEFVVRCIKEIESNEENMCTDGLYRASGNLSQVQKIRLEVDQNNLTSAIQNCSDIHVLTGSLKLFFRELKEPLIPCCMFDRVLAACSIKPREAKIKEFRDIVNSLPQCNRDTLKFLLEHLLRVTQYSERNRMHTANLAIVFGPTLLWAPAEQAHNIAIDCIQQNHVVEILLNDFKEIFDDGKGKKKT